MKSLQQLFEVFDGYTVADLVSLIAMTLVGTAMLMMVWAILWTILYFLDQAGHLESAKQWFTKWIKIIRE